MSYIHDKLKNYWNYKGQVKNIYIFDVKDGKEYDLLWVVDVLPDYTVYTNIGSMKRTPEDNILIEE